MAKRTVQVVNRRSGEVLLPAARWCAGWLCRLRGLQFRRSLAPSEALILAWKKDSVSASSIHMFFVPFPIAAVWINRQGRVTHTALAQPWRPFYASPEPACYVLETSPAMLSKLAAGDEIDFV